MPILALPQRIRAGCDAATFFRGARWDDLCHSAFARVATQPLRKVNQPAVPLPQRIRAGCDNHDKKAAGNGYSLPQRIRAGCDRVDAGAALSIVLCHSAFARVATSAEKLYAVNLLSFATAHSRGLRRQCAEIPPAFWQLCHSAFARVATLLPKKDISQISLCHSAFARVATAEKQCSALRICCEKVDSFSSVGESGLALTIFPFSFAAKATYVAINDSFGRAIDRFFGANRTGISVNYDFAEHPCL